METPSLLLYEGISDQNRNLSSDAVEDIEKLLPSSSRLSYVACRNTSSVWGHHWLQHKCHFSDKFLRTLGRCNQFDDICFRCFYRLDMMMTLLQSTARKDMKRTTRTHIKMFSNRKSTPRSVSNISSALISLPHGIMPNFTPSQNPCHSIAQNSWIPQCIKGISQTLHQLDSTE